jgi:hypothetical protein
MRQPGSQSAVWKPNAELILAIEGQLTKSALA